MNFQRGGTHKRNVDLGVIHMQLVPEARRMDREKREDTDPSKTKNHYVTFLVFTQNKWTQLLCTNLFKCLEKKEKKEISLKERKVSHTHKVWVHIWVLPGSQFQLKMFKNNCTLSPSLLYEITLSVSTRQEWSHTVAYVFSLHPFSIISHIILAPKASVKYDFVSGMEFFFFFKLTPAPRLLNGSILLWPHNVLAWNWGVNSATKVQWWFHAHTYPMTLSISISLYGLSLLT